MALDGGVYFFLNSKLKVKGVKSALDSSACKPALKNLSLWLR